MALFSLKRIAEEAGSRQTYLRGVACYNAGKVTRVTKSRDEFYEEFLTAQVENAARDDTYHVEVGFGSGGGADFYDCSCDAFRRSGGACEHIVALMVHKYYADMLSGLTTAGQMLRDKDRLAARTDDAAKRMMSNYLSREAVQLVANDTQEQDLVTLSPVLRLTPRQAELTFTLGNKRPYVLKDIGKFCKDMKLRLMVEYGKQLRFLHHPDSFAPECRPLLEFLLNKYDDIAHPQRGMYASLHPKIGRELTLSPANLDHIFDLYEGQVISQRTEGQETSPLLLRTQDPLLPIQVQRSEVKQGFTFTCDPFIGVSGAKYLYIGTGGVLYRCSPAFSEGMRELSTAFQAVGYSLFIADRDMPDFCGSVLPIVGRYTELTGCTELLDPYLPDDPELEIYLDAPEEGVITARVLCCYGSEKVPLLDTDAASAPPSSLRRNKLEELRSRLVIQKYFQSYRPDSGTMILRGDDDAVYRFITDGMAELHAIGTVYVSDSLNRMGAAPAPKVSVGVRLETGLLDLDFDLGGLDPAELIRVLDSYRRHKKYHRLRSGQFLTLEGSALEGLAQIAEGLELSDQELLSGHARTPAYRALYLDRVLRESENMEFHRDSYFKSLVKNMKSAADSDFDVPASLSGVLRNYQKTGHRWLKTMEQYGFGGILADDMGLGKTLQVISLLLDAREQGNVLPSLVVCPTSLIINWEREIRRFAPALTVLMVLGNAEQRAEAIRKISGYDVVITSYDLLKRDIPQYDHKEFRYQILDEAQYIKNHTTQNARAVKAVRSRQRFALTGTPIENRLSELWSIFDYLMPGFLFSYSRFRERFEVPIVKNGDPGALERLSRMTGPFILRRLKKEVLKELPDKTETVLYATMEEEQRQVYLANAALAREKLSEDISSKKAGGGEKNKMAVLAMLTRLRQICCDPALCYENYGGGSAKLESCMELLTEAVAAGHKVLLFSQFTSMLAILEERLKKEGLRFFTLQGSTSKEKRAAMVDSFNTDGTDVFLISLKAGGTGLNLTGADVVIHYDPWWNLSAQNQATDRAHRIGQKNSVQVYKLIAKDTIEEKIQQLQESKKELADAVIRQGDGIITSLTSEQLLDMLI